MKDSQSYLSLSGGAGANSGVFKLFLVGFVLLSGIVGAVGAVTNVTGCGTLSTPGETYVLSNDISSNGTCFTIDADNIILDGAGYSITGSGSGNGVYLPGIPGILSTLARSDVTVKNLNVNGFNYGIFIGDSSSNNTIYNNLFNNTNNFVFSGTIYANNWNTTKQAGTNIIGGSNLGGNFWAKPDGTGFSETCNDGDSNGICDSIHTLASGNVDYLPLSLNLASPTTTTTSSTTTTTTTTTSTTTTTTSTTTSTTTTTTSTLTT